jgi:hypothetical protein
MFLPAPRQGYWRDFRRLPVVSPDVCRAEEVTS